jgi:hypothetical protein
MRVSWQPLVVAEAACSASSWPCREFSTGRVDPDVRLMHQVGKGEAALSAGRCVGLLTWVVGDNIITCSGGTPQFKPEVALLPDDWLDALKLAGRSFGATVFVLLALAVVSWLACFVLQKVGARRGGGDTGEGEG